MPDDANAEVNPLLLSFEQPHLAVSMPLSFIHASLAILTDESAPHFTPDREPLSEGVVFTSTTNQNFYRPQFHVRMGTTSRPDIHFLRDASDKVRLEIVLEETTPLPNAEPFNVQVQSAALRWNNSAGVQRYDFPAPTLIPTNNPEDSSTPNYQIRIGAELPPADVERLNQALSNSSAGAMLDVNLSYSYWIDEPTNGGIIFQPIEMTPIHVIPHIMVQPQPEPEPEVRPVIEQPLSMVTPAAMRLNLMHEALVIRPGILEEIQTRRATEPNFRTTNLTRTLPFTFDPNLAQNRSIYAAIRASAGVGERWESTAFGFVRKSNIANTVYRLPDEIRLAYSNDLKTPHMIPVLFQDDTTGDHRVRVVLQAAPYHNPQKLVDLSDFLYNASGGGLAAPKVISGGYKEAKLTLTGAFPEQITALKGKEFAVELEGSFELVLDLTLEFYRFLCELLVRVGLTGEVIVSMENPPAPDAPSGTAPELIVRRVPMRLTLHDLVGLPLDMRVSDTDISPDEIEIINRSGLELECSGCVPRLLQIDDNSVVPLDVYKAETTTLFPATLAADQALNVAIKPKLEGSLLWNAVQIELLNLKPTLDTQMLLNRVHELAPSGSLALDVNIECPLFALPELPPEFVGKLFRVVVEIMRPGFAVQQVTLSKDKPTAVIKMQRTLQDLVRDDAQALVAFSYRVKNIYFTKEGSWNTPQQSESSNLFIFPNPAEV